MDDKAAAALELLEAEKEKRIQARIDAGELRVVGRDPGEHLVVGSEEMIEEAVQRAEAEALNKYGNNPPLHFDFLVIVTGVVRHGERYSRDAVPSCPRFEEPTSREEAPVEEHIEVVPTYCAPAQEEAYISLILDHGDDDGDPGTIAAGWFSVENGSLVLEGLDRRLIGTQLLREGQDALTVAKRMLKKSLGDNSDFTAPIRYPKRGVA